ncbi:MAG TPA: hypothetical protein IAA29_18955 [Candidatus Paenibacillus intestinavium]|nr:hypothetical protein [Candidatus Paenibacillus intestinavium]
MIISRKLTITIVISLIIVVVVVAIGLLYFLNRNIDQVEDQYPVVVDQDKAPIIPQSMSLEFDTNAQEAVVIWEHDQSKLYVENLHLYYSSDDGLAREELYTWDKAYQAEAWVNGEYILIGTQLIDADSAQEGHRGNWLTVQPHENGKISEPQRWHFGPQEVVSLNALEEPNLFFVRYINNGVAVNEMVYQAAQENWQVINPGLNDSVALPLEAPSNSGLTFTFEPINNLGNDIKAYVYRDDAGSIVYIAEPNLTVLRYAGYNMINTRLLHSIDDSGIVLGHFQNEAGSELFSLLSESFSSIIPVDDRLFAGEWIALNSSTFVNVETEQIETLVYNNGYSLDDNIPQYKKFLTTEAKLIKSHGSLLQYEVNGKMQYLSLYDLVHTANADFQTLLMTTLMDYEMASVERDIIDNVFETHPIFKQDFLVANTNEVIPNELDEAIDAIYEEVDYSFAKTYRKIDDLWYVIVDEKFYRYNNNELVEIGTLPITMMARIGEGFEGYGVKDFLRINDKWIFTDTEASRIIMVNEQLEVEQELAVHLPNQLSLQGDQLHVTSPTWQYTVDKDFNLIDKKKVGYESSVDRNMVEAEYFRPLQYMTDIESGLTWYYLNGYVHQYHKQKQQYRTFYTGHNVNARGTERLIPYGEEVLVMLDTRLERFDRQGQWLGVIEYPRTEPDGIYDRSPVGENSYVLDEVEDMIYLVQGYRMISIDLNNGVVNTVFQQNYSNIGNVSRYGDTITFILHSNYEDRYQALRMVEETDYSQYTELVQLDMNSYEAKRFLISGYVDGLEIDTEQPDQPNFHLYRYNE